MNKIFLIGNGFDIGHALPTSYLSFLKWYLTSLIEKAVASGKNRYNDSCIDILLDRKYSNPKHSDQVKTILESLLNDGSIGPVINRKHPDSKFKSFDISIVPANYFVECILRSCLNSEWNGIEHEIFKDLKRNHKFVLKTGAHQIIPDVKDMGDYKAALGRIKSLNGSIDCLKILLKDYLSQNCVPKKIRTDWFAPVMGFYDDELGLENSISMNLFLNFNYTEYSSDIIEELQTRYGKSGVEFCSINIHGELRDNVDDIVFGIGDEQNDFYQSIETDYDNDWLMCMKSFNYFRNHRYQDLVDFISQSNYEIYVMGHSCSITDRTLLKMLFEHDNCERINVFHHKGISSYMKTAYNIARNFSDKLRLRQVLMPFDIILKM